jgi:predicted nucleic-acid-binding Zn-ribbon protein
VSVHVPDVPWPDAEHSGCNYYAVQLDDGLFCNKCGWLWSAWPDRVSARQELLNAIDALHQPTTIQHDSFTRYGCRNCGFTWPCPTARLLHPETVGQSDMPNKDELADALIWAAKGFPDE